MPGENSSSSSNSREWYRDGLQFECTMCGNCCTGPPGTVWFTEDEAQAMAKHFGIEKSQFLKKYAHKIDGRWSLKEHKAKHGYDCIFLDRKKYPGKAVCSIYTVRPTQCQTWPFWPENLKTRRTWEEVKRVTPCPGMNTGKLYPIEAIRIQRDQTE